MEWPVFDGFQTQGRVTQAKAQLQQQEVALKKTEQGAELEVTKSLLNLTNSERFVEVQKGNAANAQEALRLAQVSYREGSATSLDVLSAEAAVALARSEYSTAVYFYEVSLLNLNAAIGTLGEEGIPVKTDATNGVKTQENK